MSQMIYHQNDNKKDQNDLNNMNKMDNNTENHSNHKDEVMVMETPQNSQERLQYLIGDFTPSPTTKIPLSLQETLSYSEPIKSKITTNTTTTTTTTTNNNNKNKRMDKNTLTTTKYTSESFQKTFHEFGQIINQRRAELSEMKRANQFRMSNQLKHNLSTPTTSDKGYSNGLETNMSTSVDVMNGNTPLIQKTSPLDTPVSSVSTTGGGGSRLLARKLILSHQKDVSPDDQHDDKLLSSNLNDDMAAEKHKSIVNEMAAQLKGEKERSEVLHKKINELHTLEEVQRTRAHGLAQEKDK